VGVVKGSDCGEEYLTIENVHKVCLLVESIACESNGRFILNTQGLSSTRVCYAPCSRFYLASLTVPYSLTSSQNDCSLAANSQSPASPAPIPYTPSNQLYIPPP